MFRQVAMPLSRGLCQITYDVHECDYRILKFVKNLLKMLKSSIKFFVAQKAKNSTVVASRYRNHATKVFMEDFNIFNKFLTNFNIL
jgi:hypothetical protein